MVIAIKILLTALLAWQVLKPIGVLLSVGHADAVYSKNRKMTPDINAKLDKRAVSGMMRLVWWLIASTLMIIGTWAYL